MENFFNKTHLFKVYLVGVMWTGLFVFILFQYVGPWLAEQQEPIVSTLVNVKISSAMGAIFGLMFMLMVSMSRKSSKFWEYAETVEKLIDKADNKSELVFIFNNEFQQLRQLAQGAPHYNEARRIYAILETKHKYMKDTYNQ